MNHTLTDSQLDTAAQELAIKNNVSYYEAAQSVATLAQYQGSQFSEAATPTGSLTNDNELHQAVVIYAAKNAMTYEAALKRVVALLKINDTQFNENYHPTDSHAEDFRLDCEAKNYALTHCVSYSEALDRVSSKDLATFSELSASAVALARQQLEIFKTGTHTDGNGVARTFSLSDVQSMASCYSTSKHEAPLTLGHPSDDKPAYGWVKSLQTTDDGRLLMSARQLDSAFAENVQSGRYKKRSAAFYPPEHVANPVPGKWYLRHVACLGAVPPAVRGMPDAKFDGPVDGTVFFDL